MHPSGFRDGVLGSPASGPPSQQELLERLELLWKEAIEGLEASKEAILMQRRDGSSMEVPGDLRARAGFIREARALLESIGAISPDDRRGHLPALKYICIPKAQLPESDLLKPLPSVRVIVDEEEHDER